MTVLDSVLEITGSMAMMLGYSYNTDDEGELNEVKDAMLELSRTSLRSLPRSTGSC